MPFEKREKGKQRHSLTVSCAPALRGVVGSTPLPPGTRTGCSVREGRVLCPVPGFQSESEILALAPRMWEPGPPVRAHISGTSQPRAWGIIDSSPPHPASCSRQSLAETKLPGSLPTPFPALTQRHSADGQGWFGQVARGLVQGDQGQLTPQKNQTQNETDL